ncbi:6629_t:CDS:2 [Ambispora gerdemannii]|uniref:Gamma-soluble NSF attachment protein n=1 Tax=Ambispora gerdemannii TaxID=144530 RepID=A0A9N9BPX5_9GLOM|nr:6629_t:CDS:2 [Ambispora gerdemannii]
MLGWLLFSVFLYAAYKTNPDNISFGSYITSDNKNKKNQSNAISSFITGILSNKPRVPEFKRDDYLCFSIVTLGDGSATYLGVFGVWFVLRLEMQSLENLATNEKNQAIKAKGARDCEFLIDESAAKHYLSAAKRFQSVGDDHNQIEAGGCYENAYLAFQQTKQTAKALQALETAASIYEFHDKHVTRAARVYEQLAKLYENKTSAQLDLQKALTMHQKAAELFEREGDNRQFFSLISQIELMAELGRYEEAIKILENVIATAANDRVLSFKVKDYCFLQCVCLIALRDWIRVEKQYEELCQLYPSFVDSRESKLIKKLIESINAYDTSAFATACQEYDTLTPFPPWQIEILLQAKKGLEVEDFR